MQSRALAALAAFQLVSCAAYAGVADELITAINKCSAIPDDNTRHRCYDTLPALVRSFTAAKPAEAAKTVVAAPAPPAAKPQEESSIFSRLLGNADSEPAPADAIAATIESYTFDYGLFVVTLDNGQVWRQVAAIGDVLHLSKDRKDKVAIWRNAFGDDVLKIEGFRTKYHVRRIK